MTIAFDLDGTLIDSSFEPEKSCSWFWEVWGAKEKLRKGTGELIRELKQNKHQIWVYTSSLRSPFYIRSLFKKYRIRLDGVVNQDIHNRAVKKLTMKRIPSKYPPIFGIDVLIEDQIGVKEEGVKFGFQVIHVFPANQNWVKDVIQEIHNIDV